MSTIVLISIIVLIALALLGGWFFFFRVVPSLYEESDAEKTDQAKNHVRFIDTVSTELNYDDEPQLTGYYLPDEGLIRMYYQLTSYPSDAELTVETATDEAEAKSIFDAFLHKKQVEAETAEKQMIEEFENEDMGTTPVSKAADQAFALVDDVQLGLDWYRAIAVAAEQYFGERYSKSPGAKNYWTDAVTKQVKRNHGYSDEDWLALFDGMDESEQDYVEAQNCVDRWKAALVSEPYDDKQDEN